MSKFFLTVKKHKIVFLILLLAIIGGGYYGYNKYKASNVKPTYVTAAVAKGTIVTSVSGSGQISASNQVDLKAKVSGDIIKVLATDGQQVKAGDAIAQINARDAYKTVRDAQSNLQSAQLAMDKLTQAADSYSILQAENALTAAQAGLDKLKLSQPADYQSAVDAKKKAEDQLAKAYDDTFNAIANVYLDLPTIMAKLNDMLYSNEIGKSEVTVGKSYDNSAVLANSITDYNDKARLLAYQINAVNDYNNALSKYDINFSDYKNASRYSDRAVIESLLSETSAATKLAAQAVKSESNYFDVWTNLIAKRGQTVYAKVSEYQTNLSTYTNQTSGHLSDLSSSQSTLADDKNAIISADNNLQAMKQNNPLDLAAAQASVKEKQASLVKLKVGADPLDIKSQELSVQQRRNSLYDAQAVLADYTIKAPFDGVIAKVNVKIGDAASGASLATIITKQQIVEISLNEVDVTKVKLGLKVSLTFDAIDGLEITGKVVDIDTVGTVTQNVVSYTVRIALDTQDDRIKTGMSVNAMVITNVKTDILTVPSSAVKINNGGGSYAQILDAAGNPQSIAVQTGLANDTDTEIISGLNEGDRVVTQIINPTGATAASAQSGSSANRAGGFGGGIRIPGLGGGGAGR